MTTNRPNDREIKAARESECEEIAMLVDHVAQYAMRVSEQAKSEDMKRHRRQESVRLSELALDIRNGEHHKETGR